MVIRNVPHPHIVNERVFVVKTHTRMFLCLVQIDKSWRERDIDTLKRIQSRFSFHGLSVTRKQFPVRLPFDDTVHRSQGQTLDKSLVDLRSPFLSPGQLCAALSRVRKSQDVLLLHKEEDAPLGGGEFHQMPLTVPNPILPEAVRFPEGVEELSETFSNVNMCSTVMPSL